MPTSGWPLGSATAALVALGSTATAWLVLTGTAPVAPGIRTALPAMPAPAPGSEVVVVPPLDPGSDRAPGTARGGARGSGPSGPPDADRPAAASGSVLLLVPDPAPATRRPLLALPVALPPAPVIDAPLDRGATEPPRPPDDRPAPPERPRPVDRPPAPAPPPVPPAPPPVPPAPVPPTRAQEPRPPVAPHPAARHRPSDPGEPAKKAKKAGKPAGKPGKEPGKPPGQSGPPPLRPPAPPSDRPRRAPDAEQHGPQERGNVVPDRGRGHDAHHRDGRAKGHGHR